jgi:hypothetical protein
MVVAIGLPSVYIIFFTTVSVQMAEARVAGAPADDNQREQRKRVRKLFKKFLSIFFFKSLTNGYFFT